MRVYILPIGKLDVADAMDGNVDVRIDLDDGRSFSATFFTLRNVASLLQKYQSTGECANGTYFWASDTIVVERLSEEIINKVIQDLVLVGDIEAACSRIA